MQVRFALQSRERRLTVVAPLKLRFDPDFLTFQSCTALSAGKSALYTTIERGVIGVAVSGGVAPISDGDFLECGFRIAVGASGTTNISFASAALSDDRFAEIAAVGSGASVSVGSPPTPSPTRPPSNCAGDCDNDGVLGENDLRRGIGLLFGGGVDCSIEVFDLNDDGRIVIAEILLAEIMSSDCQ